jgi:hypothetical protein
MAPSEQEFAEQVARSVVGRVAPEEEEIFDLVAAAYRRDPQRLARGASRDEMLGFGVDATVALLTPIVLGAATEVVRYLAMETAGAIEVRSRLQRIFRRRDARRDAVAEKPIAVAAINPATRTAVREIVLEKCRQAGVEPDRAELVADAVVGVLSAHD